MGVWVVLHKVHTKPRAHRATYRKVKEAKRPGSKANHLSPCKCSAEVQNAWRAYPQLAGIFPDICCSEHGYIFTLIIVEVITWTWERLPATYFKPLETFLRLVNCGRAWLTVFPPARPQHTCSTWRQHLQGRRQQPHRWRCRAARSRRGTIVCRDGSWRSRRECSRGFQQDRRVRSWSTCCHPGWSSSPTCRSRRKR